MLTETYTLVALSVEQANVRVSLLSLQQSLYTNWIQQCTLTTGQVDYACDSLQRLYDSWNWRKLEQFLIPAMQGATKEADQLLLELDRLNLAAAEAMGAIAERFSGLSVDSAVHVSEFCGSVDMFFKALLQRLTREEQELLPVARSVITGEAWFSIANKMLAHDAFVQESRPTRVVAAPSQAPANDCFSEQRASKAMLVR